MRLCTKCSVSKPLNDFYTQQKSGRKRIHFWCKECHSKNVIQRQRANKAKAVAYKGGKCSACGYDKCQAALVFHHTDPSKKDFGIGSHTKKAWDLMKPELDKCILLCANCHFELHWSLTKA